MKRDDRSRDRPPIDLWQPMGGDLLLVARRERHAIDMDLLRTAMEDGVYARAARSVWRTTSAEGVLAHFIGSSRLSDILVERALGAVNTDDQNFLEFAFARSLGVKRPVDGDLVALSRRLRTDVPDSVGKVDWSRVREERWLFQQVDGVPLSPPEGNGPGIASMITAFGEGRYAAALKIWKSLHRTGDESFGESAIVAECAARVGGNEDESLIDRAPLPERNVLRAIWLARHGDPAAAALLVGVFTAARTDPWLRPHLLESAMSLAGEIGPTNPLLGRALYDSLKESFAIEASSNSRLITAARIAATLPDPALCIEALEKLEPPLWTRAALELRLRCYRRAGHPRAAAAEADLLQLMERDTPLGASIPTPPPALAR